MARNMKRLRENIRFLGGIIGLCYEMIIEHSDRPALLAVFAAMIGVDVIVTNIGPRGDDE